MLKSFLTLFFRKVCLYNQYFESSSSRKFRRIILMLLDYINSNFPRLCSLVRSNFVSYISIEYISETGFGAYLQIFVMAKNFNSSRRFTTTLLSRNGCMEVKFRGLLIWEVEGDDCSGSRSGRFIPSAQWIGGWRLQLVIEP